MGVGGGQVTEFRKYEVAKTKNRRGKLEWVGLDCPPIYVLKLFGNVTWKHTIMNIHIK